MMINETDGDVKTILLHLSRNEVKSLLAALRIAAGLRVQAMREWGDYRWNDVGMVLEDCLKNEPREYEPAEGDEE